MIIKKPNNVYIEAAIDFLDNQTIITKQISGRKVIESKYNSYISSFGGSIIQSGLLATLKIFEANDEKNKIIEALFYLLNSREKVSQIEKTKNNYYKTIKIYNNDQANKIRDELIEMAVSLKLAMRCFEQVENTN